MAYEVQQSIGADIAARIHDLATLRLEIFREYPYLYRGTRDAEHSYLQVYARSEAAIALTVSHDGLLAGAVTALPLRDETDDLTSPFLNSPYPIESLFYIGELLFYPPHRNRGLGSRLLALVEEHARRLGGYRGLTCATVRRPGNHTQRPEGYLPIDHFVQRHGFQRLNGMSASFVWQELDGRRIGHGMDFWLKELQ